MDIDPVRLADTEVGGEAGWRTRSGACPTIEATTDLRQALDGADYAINMIQVGGYRPATVIDFEIPKRYGLRQTIGDTLGIGGIMRALRTIPVMLDIGRRDGGGLPGRALPQLHQPDGDALHGHEPGDVGSHRRALPQRAGHGRGYRGLARSALRRGQLRLRRHQPRRLLPALRARRRRPLSRPCGRSRPMAASQPGSGCASRSSAASATSSPSRASISPSTCPGSSSRVATI